MRTRTGKRAAAAAGAAWQLFAEDTARIRPWDVCGARCSRILLLFHAKAELLDSCTRYSLENTSRLYGLIRAHADNYGINIYVSVYLSNDRYPETFDQSLHQPISFTNFLSFWGRAGGAEKFCHPSCPGPTGAADSKSWTATPGRDRHHRGGAKPFDIWCLAKGNTT